MKTKKETPRSLLCRILWLYYVQQMNQREIGDYLGLSRVKVVRLLKEGRELGLVDIQIKSDHLFLFDMEMELCALTGLRKAWVVPAGGDPIEAVGAGAVYRFQQALQTHKRISIGSGRTFNALSRYLPSMSNVAAEEIISVGAFETDDFLYRSQTFGHYLTSKVQVKFFQVKIPSFSNSPEVLKAWRESEIVSEALEKVNNGDISFTSVAAADSSQYLYYTRVSEQERSRLLALGVVAEMNGNFFDADGAFIDAAVTERIHIPLPMRCPVVLVAGGINKMKATAAVLRSGFVDELVVDEESAACLIELFKNSPMQTKVVRRERQPSMK